MFTIFISSIPPFYFPFTSYTKLLQGFARILGFFLVAVCFCFLLLFSFCLFVCFWGVFLFVSGLVFFRERTLIPSSVLHEKWLTIILENNNHSGVRDLAMFVGFNFASKPI